MFRQSSAIMLFYIFFASMALVLFLQINSTTYASHENTTYGVKLTAASQAAINTIDYQKATKGKLWNEKSAREKALEAFYHTLAASFSESSTDNSIQVYTPIALFVDTDGYYIGYNATFDLANMADPTKENYFVNSMQTTELIPWCIEYNGYSIRFYLDETYVIISPSGKKYKLSFRGDIEKLEDELTINEEDLTAFEEVERHLKEDVKFETLLVSQIQETIQKYINEYNVSAVINSRGYSLEMPSVPGEAWHRLLENPTFVAFYQGRNINTGKNIINAYAYAGSESRKSDVFFITASDPSDPSKPKYYHRLNAEKDAGHAVVDKDEDGTFIKWITDPSAGTYERIEKVYDNAEECARQGASPCPDCVYGISY